MPLPEFPHAETKSLTSWSNFSGTIQKGAVPLYVTPLAHGPDLTAAGALAPQLGAVRELLRYCFARQLRLRPVGTRWSFSSIIEPDQVILDPGFMSGMLRVGPASLTPEYSAGRGAQGFAPFWICGGRTVAMTNVRLLEEGFCLQTSGAGDGQRVAGAVATGTHSSDLRVGAMHDALLGIQLVTGPDRCVFLQPERKPALSEAFVLWLSSVCGMHVQHIQDDALFHAAQVSLGSLGVVFSVVLEAAPAYRFVRRITRFEDRNDPALWRAIRLLDTGSLHPDRPHNPDHLDVVFHPYPESGKTSAWLTTMWKVPAPPVLAHAMPVPLAIASDVMSLIAGLFDALDGEITTDLTTPILAGIISDETEALYAEGDIEAYPGQLFGTNNLPAGSGASTEIITDHRDSGDLMRVLYEVLDQHSARGEHLLGAAALRFVPSTRATLGMNIKPLNAYLELPSIRNEGTLAIYDTLFDELERQGIAYTCHWGQQHGMDEARLRAWFGARVDRWKAARDALIGEDGKKVFSAKILEEVGLS